MSQAPCPLQEAITCHQRHHRRIEVMGTCNQERDRPPSLTPAPISPSHLLTFSPPTKNSQALIKLLFQKLNPGVAFVYS
ncbi:hypothetical protein E4U16_003684 [Claviceps sp. LM84 group G4]|nr:hypothetical protein E4U16_003684 [Claviceps sp. LM84 group G4]